MVTWQKKKHLAGWHITHWGEKNKEKDYIIQKANILSFRGAIALLAFQQGVFGTI